ncbi:MAG: hypothetical protein AAFP84_13765, partial [Actinomycetota bacterium]
MVSAIAETTPRPVTPTADRTAPKKAPPTATTNTVIHSRMGHTARHRIGVRPAIGRSHQPDSSISED